MLFSSLGTDEQKQLEESGQRKKIKQGEVLMRLGEEADSIFFLTSGTVEVQVDDILVRVLRAPEVLGLLSVLDGKQRSATVRAFSDVEVLQVSKENFERLLKENAGLNRSLIHHLATSVRTLYSRETLHHESLMDYFQSPGATLVPGPYVADPFEMYMFVMEGDPARLASLMPSGHRLIPGLGGRYLLCLNLFESLRSEAPNAPDKAFRYREVTPFIPCLNPIARPYVFCPELYPDNYLAIAIGREMYGFPKRYGRIELEERAFDLFVGGRLIVRGSWGNEEPLDEGDFLTDISNQFLPDAGLGFLFKAVGAAFDVMGQSAVSYGLAPRVPVILHSKRAVPGKRFLERSLNRVDFELTHLDVLRHLESPQFVFHDADHLLHGKALAGYVVQVGFRFEDAKVKPTKTQIPMLLRRGEPPKPQPRSRWLPW